MWHPNIPLLLLPLLLGTLSSHAQNDCRGDKSTAGYCTPLTYEDTTADFDAPPTAADCQDTCAAVNSDPGDWLVDFSADAPGARHPLLLHRCGFAVAPAGDGTPRDARFSLANQDILDLFDESLARFGRLHGGGVSARGTMRCGDDSLLVEWFIQDLSA